jgi:hypothetical protein
MFLGLRLGLPMLAPPPSGGAPASTARIMGALTPAGMGDIPITGASISSGNGSGHFQVTGGAIVGSAAGVAAGYNAGPYTLTTNNGQVFVITTVANAYSIGKQDDFFTGPPYSGVGQLIYHSVSLNGKRIIGRPSLTCASGIDGGFASPLRNTNFGDSGTGWAGVTLESEDYANPWTWTDTQITFTSRYMQLKGIKGTVPAGTASAFFLLAGSPSLPVTDIIFDSCQVIGPTKDVNSNVWANDDGTLWSNGRAFSDDGSGGTSNIRIIGCDIRYTERAIVIPARLAVDADAGHLVPQPLHIAGNYIYGFYEHGINISKIPGDNAPVTVEDNVFDTLVGIASDNNGPPNTGSPGSGPHPDAIFSSAAGSTTDWTWTINRNFFFKNGRGSGPIALRNMPVGFYHIVTAIGNICTQGSSEGFFIASAKSNVILYNAILSHEASDTLFKGLITIGSEQTSGTHRLTKNITEAYDLGGSPTLSGNVTMGDNEGTIAFSSVFVGSRPQTRADALTAMNPSNVLGSNNVS